MGKKRRYRKFPQKFGRKYALKYGITINAPENEEIKIVEAVTPSTLVVATTPTPEKSATPTVQEVKLESVETPVEVVKPKVSAKKKPTAEKKTPTTTRKTTRKRTTKAKTTT